MYRFKKSSALALFLPSNPVHEPLATSRANHLCIQDFSGLFILLNTSLKGDVFAVHDDLFIDFSETALRHIVFSVIMRVRVLFSSKKRVDLLPDGQLCTFALC